MEQNKFEKDIRQKLDELKIPPSEAVWQNVEKRIAIKQTRRRGVLVLFFIALFLLTGGYFWLHINNENESRKREVVLQNEGLRTRDSLSMYQLVPGKKDINTMAPQTEKTLSSTIIKSVTNQISEKPKSRKTVFSKKGKVKTNIAKGFAVNEDSITAVDEKVEKLQNDLSPGNEDVAIKKTEETKPGAHDLKDEVALTDSIRQPNTTMISLEKKDTSSISKVEKKIVSNHKRKWRPGITLSGGASLIGNEFLSGGNNLYSDYLSSSPLPGSGTGNSSYFYSSAVRSSFAFFGGFFIEKNISVNHRISVGINYKYFSTLNRVGYKIDSAQTAYNFSTGTTASGDHRNSFSYLDIPITITFRIGNAKSFPLFWHAGVNISELVYSNALQFKSVPGIYYIDNSFFNKTQFGFNTGFSTTLFSDRKSSLQIGPYFYYSASRLADKGMYGKKHFSYVGISTQLLFNKK
jgi:hypothetical protein